MPNANLTPETVVAAAAAAEPAEPHKAKAADCDAMATPKLTTEAHPPHTKARSTPYLNGPERTAVPDDKVSWGVPWADYAPVNFIAPPVASQPVWADDPANIKNIKFNELDGKVNRVSFEGKYEVTQAGMPLNPRGRTGMCERGLLGRFGPNHAADPVVTRWVRTEDGDIVKNAEGEPVLEFVAIKRKDNGEWAIPGGMVAAGETVSLTLKREFGEEAFNTIEATKEEREQIEKRLEEFFKAGDTIYKGYVDDPRNTDNAWMETVVQNFHDETGQITAEFKLHAGDDAGDVCWASVTPDIQLYASHSNFIQEVYRLRLRQYAAQKASTKKRRVSVDM